MKQEKNVRLFIPVIINGENTVYLMSYVLSVSSMYNNLASCIQELKNVAIFKIDK